MSGRRLISLLLPTRKRPELARRFLRSVLTTAQYPESVEIILYADEDDAESHDLDCTGLTILRIIGPRQSMGGYNTACLAQASGDIIALMNDDVVIRTTGWDEALRQLDALVPDKVYLIYGNDMFKGKTLCTFPILSRRTCEILREPYHHAYRGAFIDYHLMDIFKRLEHSGYRRLFYLPDIAFEHLHYRAGKADFDETYGQRGRYDDDMIFVSLAQLRTASMALLSSAIEGTYDEKNSDALSALPVFTPVPRPTSPIYALSLFTREFLLDCALPGRWRFFLWWWFNARYLTNGLQNGIRLNSKTMAGD
ncbi:glycosyltransferase family 2 protein [Acidocella sp.]|uniref:glycosyltransferase family 2 protein n=1 Tax=Acidocella sp. TaxID=50710 RepID=UPI00260EAEA6|nr:glycosyltransferase family 2 protein [Acidocella sp.]